MSQEHKDNPKTHMSISPSVETLEKMRTGEIPINVDDIITEAQKSLIGFRNYLSALDPEMYPTVISEIAGVMIRIANDQPDRPLRFIGYSTLAVNLAVDGKTAAEMNQDSYNIYRASFVEAQGLENLGRCQEAKQAYITADEHLFHMTRPIRYQPALLAYGKLRKEINDIRLGDMGSIPIALETADHIASPGEENDIAVLSMIVEGKLAFADSVTQKNPDLARQTLNSLEWTIRSKQDLQRYEHLLAFIRAKIGQAHPQ